MRAKSTKKIVSNTGSKRNKQPARTPHNGIEDPRSPEANVRRLAHDGILAKAAQRAIRAQRAAGLAVTYKRGDRIIKKHPDGREEILEELAPAPEFRVPRGVSILKSE